MGMQRPLDGIRVVSLAEQWPGPLASMVLADLGADVILVERPQGGDPTRRFSGHFEALNRNKRSIVLDLKNEACRAVFRSLLATADVLMEGFRPGVMSRLGFGPTEMRAAFPSLIYTSISSFGHSGPMSPRGGHDLLVQGLAGYVTQGENPGPAPLALGDLSSAMYATIGITTALYARKTSGSGVHVDVAMLDTVTSWRNTLLVPAMNDLDGAPYPPEDPGYGVFRVGPDGTLVTLSIAGEDHQWRELCAVLGLPDLTPLTTEEREQQAPAIRDRLTAALKDRRLADIEGELGRRGVGIGQVNDDLAVARDPQIKARGLIVEVEGSPGRKFVKQPIQFDGWSGDILRPSPALGEHTRELLEELGFDARAMAEFIAQGGSIPEDT